MYGGIVPMSSVGDVGTWDPQATQTLFDIQAMSRYYTGLLQFDPHRPGVVICDLCEEFSVSSDGKSWTFKLHKGVTWWDGKETTAEDVKWSFERIVMPGEPRAQTGRLTTYFDRAEVVDKNTVIIHIKAAAAAFTRILALDSFKIMPQHWVEAGNDPKSHGNIMGNGPFMPVSYREAVSYTAEKNPNYFREGLPYFDGTKTFILNDPGTEVAAYKTERVFMSGSTETGQGIESLNRLARDNDFLKKYDLWWLPGINGIHLLVNIERPPYDNPIVREAINLAIHRQPMIDNLGFGQYTIGKGMGPNNPFALPDDEILKRPGFRELNGKKHPDDITRARELWAEAGYGPGNVLKAVIMAPNGGPHPDQAQIIKSQLEDVLVHVNLEFRLMDIGAWVGAMRNAGYDMSSSGMGGGTNDPDDRFQALYTKGSRNWARHEVAGVKELFDRQSQEIDHEKRREISWEMQRLVLDGAPATMETLWESEASLVHKRIMTKVGRYVSASGAYQVMQHYHEWLLPETPDRPAFGAAPGFGGN